LSPSGDNLVTVLDQVMTGANRTARAELEAAIHQNIPSIQGIALPASTTMGGAKTLEYILSGNGEGVSIPSVLASDGLLLLTAFLALAYSNTPEIIFIEEPENGLHFSRLKRVIDLLRKMSRGEVGFRPHQIIITTHSPLLLNFARPEEVRIFRRSVDGGTEVQSMAKVPDIDKLLDEFGTGELWYSLGEEGLLKGVRT
jgi:predicted ATPase